MKLSSTSAIALMALAAGCHSADHAKRQAAPASTERAVQSGATVSVATPLASQPSAPTILAEPTAIPATLDGWEQFDFASQRVPASALASLPLEEVQRLRAIIFGRHGRIFQDSTLEAWLLKRPWYQADGDFTNARLTDGERANLETVREAEAAKHKQIESGDMRFYQNRVITTAMLGDHSPQDWEVLEGEVLANHGYVFAHEDSDDDDDRSNRVLGTHDLQRYFEERYWYKPDRSFSPRGLSPIEKQNLDTIAIAVMKQNKRSVSPGVMHLFTATPLTDTMLANVNLADLRIVRNEIYARHGRPFETPWIAQYFANQPWYSPRKAYSDAELSPIEKANIALITTREETLHQQLATKLLTTADLVGLAPDDARRLRNEIYARRGRRFKDPQLQRYFAGFAWYRPTGSFRESQLTETERRNAELIYLFEHQRFTEG